MLSATSSNNIGEAWRIIKFGDADAMVAGGAEASIRPMGLAGFPNMDRWTARGTLQLALMDAGLEAANASAAQLMIVVDRLLPRQLQSHGGADVNAICSRLRRI